MVKKWKDIIGSSCPYCGSSPEILVDEDLPDNCGHEEDKIRCSVCFCPGQWLVDAVDECGWIDWHDELNCNCDWCKEHPVD